MSALATTPGRVLARALALRSTMVLDSYNTLFVDLVDSTLTKAVANEESESFSKVELARRPHQHAPPAHSLATSTIRST